MKFIFAIGVLLVGVAVFADDRALVESLEKRAEALLAKTQAQFDALKKDHANLLTTLDNDLTLADSFVISLKAQLADKTKQFESAVVHVIEEDLQHLENSIEIELKNVNDIISTHKSTGKTNTQLLAHGQELLRKAHEALVVHRHAVEGRAIEREIQLIEHLIKEIEAKPSVTDLAKDEAALARHELTLQTLIDAANIRVVTNPHNPGNPGNHHNPGK